jgi:hypothetical protein
MKTIFFKLTLVFIFLAFTTLAFASGESTLKASLKLKSNAEVAIHLDGNSNQTIAVKVYNDKGDIVAYKSLMNSGSKIINHKISDFPDGIYTYEVVEGKELLYTAKVVKSPAGSLECRNLPVGKVASVSEPKAGQVLVRLFGSPDTKTKIVVTDAEGNLLYRKVIKKVENAKITYDITNFPEGEYSFSVFDTNNLIAYRKITK